jgi:hypothetical protein
MTHKSTTGRSCYCMRDTPLSRSLSYAPELVLCILTFRILILFAIT